MVTSWRPPKTQEELKICTQRLKKTQNKKKKTYSLYSNERISNIERILFKNNV